MRPHFDGYYLSSRMRSEDWHAGVCMVRDYFRYLKLFADGRWLQADRATSTFDFPSHVAGVRRQDFRTGWAGRHPYDCEYEFVHQTGRFYRKGNRLAFVFRHELIELSEFRWELRIASPHLLVSEAGAVFVHSSETQPSRGPFAKGNR